MDVTLIYFSQTGSTRKVAEAIAGGFREARHGVRLVSLKEATPGDAVGADLLGMGSPCFTSRAPTPVKAFLRTLPPMDDRRAFVFATSGGAPGRVLYDLTSLLRRKGAEVVGGFLSPGEVHHPAPALNGWKPGHPNTGDLARARCFALALAEHVALGRSGPLAESRPDALRPGWGFYNLVALIAPDPILRFMLPEPRLDKRRCDQCQRCVCECPVQNVTLEPYPVLGSQCIRCYRCLTSCPEQAFEANWQLGNLCILALYNKVFVRWFGDSESSERVY